MKILSPDVEVIVPVLNEAANITELVKRIHAALSSNRISYNIIFIDDHSSDDTAKVIRAVGKRFPVSYELKKGRKGKAYSILQGARLSRAPILAMMDGDLQYPPESLPEMYLLAKEHGMVVANRKKKNTSLARRIVSSVARLTGKTLLGLNCDAQSGMKVFKREIIEAISENEVKPWALDMPLLRTSRDMGFNVQTIEIEFSQRTKGSSKISFAKASFEIFSTAVSLMLSPHKPIAIKPYNNSSPIGAGVIDNGKRFVTHSTLNPEDSALRTFTLRQIIFISLVALVFAICIYLEPLNTFILLIAILSVIYFIDVIFGIFILGKSLYKKHEVTFTNRLLKNIDEKGLPVYTILCPLYKESEVLPQFIESIRRLDWPKNKLDVIILLEQDDFETANVAAELNMPSYVRVVTVPDSKPRTKPKACNYGLALAKGQYVVVYDAEDRPDPLQLKKAYLAFKKLGSKVFCLQSKLNYYNPDHNLLTRLFTAEYSLWFSVLLPGIQSIGAVVPLGGTSNHFRTRALLNFHGWDPFNVTEDCDLGVRIFKAGYETAIIDSTTYEEANSSIGNWIRQRSRWIKGYMQTYLVHMRHPLNFFRTHGIQALVFQLIIGMRMVFILINPLLWAMTIGYFAARSTFAPTIEALYPAPIIYVAVSALVIGNFAYIYSYMIGLAKTNNWHLIKYVFFVPFYWILASLAAFKAVSQLVFKPHYWEKTLHGLHLNKNTLRTSPALASAHAVFPQNIFSRAKTISPGFSLIVAAVIANFINFTITVFLGRTMPAEDFGLIALMNSLLVLILLPADGIGNTASHEAAYLFGKHKRVSGELWKKYKARFLGISLIMALAWSVSIPVLVPFFNSHRTMPFIFFIPVLIFLVTGSFNSGFLRGSFRFELLAMVVVIEAAIKFVLAVGLSAMGYYELVYAALPVSLIISVSLGFILAKRVSKNNLPAAGKSYTTVESTSLKKSFFVTSVLVGATSLSFMSLDLVFVKHFMSAAMAGQYALLGVAGKMVYMVGALFSQFILPIASRETGQKANKTKTFYLLLGAVTLSTLSMFVVVGPLGKYTAPLVFGEKASPIIALLTPFALSMVLFSIGYSIVLYNIAKRRLMLVIPGIATVAFISASLYFMHDSLQEVVGAMLASSAFFLSSSIIFHLYYGQISTIALNIRDLFGVFALSANGKSPLPSGNLRILIFNWRDIKHKWAGGAEVYIHELAKNWVNSGHKVTLFCGNDRASRREEIIDGVKIIRRGGFFTVYLWAFVYYVLRFRKKYDIIIESENGVPFFTPLYSIKPKILIVHHIHQEVFMTQLKFPWRDIARFVEGKIMPFIYKGKTIVSVSSSTKDGVIKNKIANHENIHVVTPGVRYVARIDNVKTNYPSFVYLGRHKAYKNIDIAIKAFSKVLKHYPNAKFTIAGEGEDTRRLVELTKKLKIKHAVNFTGKVNELEKNRILASAWAAVQPSSFEGWGITVLEANAMKTLVIASRVPGLVDSVVDGKTGLLVSPKNPILLADSMLRIARDARLRKRLSAGAHRWSKEFSWQTKSEEFLSIMYRSINRDALKTRPLSVVNTSSN